MFGSSKSDTEKIVQIIESSESPYQILANSLESMDNDLARFIFDAMKCDTSVTGTKEITFQRSVTDVHILPGDIVVKSYRDPEEGDLIKIGGRDQQGEFFNMYVEVQEISLKNRMLTVEDPIEDNTRTRVGFNNFLYVIDENYDYGTEEWEEMKNTLDLNFDAEQMKSDIEQSIELLKKGADTEYAQEVLEELRERKESLT